MKKKTNDKAKPALEKRLEEMKAERKNKKMDPEINQEFGRRLKKFRTARKMTQVALAAAIDIKGPHLANIEQGRQSLSLYFVHQLSKALDVNIIELVSDDSPNNDKQLQSLKEANKFLKDNINKKQREIEILKDANQNLANDITNRCKSDKVTVLEEEIETLRFMIDKKISFGELEKFAALLKKEGGK